MTTTHQLRGLAVAALTETTDAGRRVYASWDQASWDGKYPVVFVHLDEENGKSFGRHGAPAFSVTSTLLVEGRIGPTAKLNEAGALHVKLETLRDQIKVAVINDPPLMAQLSQFSFFRTRIVSEPDEAGALLGVVRVELGLEFVQGPEDFFAVKNDSLKSVAVQIQEADGTLAPGLTIDLPQ